MSEGLLYAIGAIALPPRPELWIAGPLAGVLLLLLLSLNARLSAREVLQASRALTPRDSV